MTNTMFIACDIWKLLQNGPITRQKLLATLWDKKGYLSFDVNPAIEFLINERAIQAVRRGSSVVYSVRVSVNDAQTNTRRI